MDTRRANSYTATAFKSLVVAVTMVVTLTNYPSAVSAQVFPAGIQERIDTQPFFPPLLVNQSSLLDRYVFIDFYDGFRRYHLLRYSIGSGSSFERWQDDYPTPLAGAVWLLMADEYRLREYGYVDLYHEQVLPNTEFAFTGDDNPITHLRLMFSDNGLLVGGGGYYRFEGELGPGSDLIAPIPGCLGIGCYEGAEVNLLGVRYVQDGNLLRATFLSQSEISLEGRLLFSDYYGSVFDVVGDVRLVSRSFVVNAVPELLLGDCNQDGVVSFLDIGPFISLVSVGDFLAEADINEDGFVNFLDISPFIFLLSN